MATRQRRNAWHRNYERAATPPAELERARALPAGYRLLVVAEDWCGDSVNTVPYLARLVEQIDGLELRVIGGRSWELAGRTSGAVYGAGHVPETDILVAVGPAGIDLSVDLGATWRRVDERSHWAVAFASARRGWAVGPGGSILRIEPS